MAPVNSKVRPLIVRIVNNGDIHVADCCNVCSKAGDDRFTWLDPKSVLKVVSSFTHFDFDWKLRFVI